MATVGLTILNPNHIKSSKSLKRESGKSPQNQTAYLIASKIEESKSIDTYTPRLSLSRSTPIPAWLSTDATIEEINVIGQFFTISGYLTVFWKDEEFDQDCKLKDIVANVINHEKSKDTHLNKLQSYISHSNISRPSQVDTDSNEDKKEDPEDAKDGHDKEIIDLTHFKHVFLKKYPLPFVPSLADDQLVIFKNALEFKFTGYKPIDLDYNIKDKVFRLQIQFKAKLYECFENNNNEFPFEWQFLNVHISYRKNLYNFESSRPKFVTDAFGTSEYEHAATVRKLDNVDEWKLLRPWVDLRREDDYGHKFEFGLIKYRVRRNPHYYMLEVMIPLFLMVMCAFCVLLPAWNDTEILISDKLGYIVTLLLAVAAFQISITDGMPYKSQFTLVDGYFLLAYIVLAGLVIEQSIEMSVDDDEDWMLTVFAGCGLLAIWLIHSMKFVFKWMTHSRLKAMHFYPVLDFCGIKACVTEASRCCAVKAKCITCCRKAKREKRLEKWMRMEKNEASTWDSTKKKGDYTAELVLGTEDKDQPYAPYIDTQGEYNGEFLESRKKLTISLKDDDEKCCGCFKIYKCVYSCSCWDNDSCLSTELMTGSKNDLSVALVMKDEKYNSKNGNEENNGYGSCVEC